MPIQVLLGHKRKGDKHFYHTLQMDIESLLYDVLSIAIHQSGPRGAKRDLTEAMSPAVYGGLIDNPTEMWSYSDKTLVQLGMQKGSTLTHMKGAIFPWIHPYFDDMKQFFLEFADVLFPPPPAMNREDWEIRVCSEVDVRAVIDVIRRYRKIVKEPGENLLISGVTTSSNASFEEDDDDDDDPFGAGGAVINYS